MKEKLKQYKNLILVAAAVILVIVILIGDPIGFFAERRHVRMQIQNLIAIEEAETQQKIAIIRAQTVAEQMRIREEAGISVQVIDVGIQDIREPVQRTADVQEEEDTQQAEEAEK